MFRYSTAATAALVSAAVLAVQADVVPTAPYGGVVDRTGQACDIQYNLDTTGTWTNMTIELMTGDNFHMVHLDTVATDVDGTTGTGRLSWTCPEVTPNAAIYFYQFTNNGADPTWTTRFTIAAADGTTVAAPNATQPDGKAIPWGTGALVGAATDGGSSSSATSAAAGSAGVPVGGSSSTTGSSASGSASSASSSSSAGSSPSASGDSTTVVTVQPSSTSSRSSRASSAAPANSSDSTTASAGTRVNNNANTASSASATTSNTSGAGAAIAVNKGSSVAGAGLVLALLAGLAFA